MNQYRITDDLQALLEVFPPRIAASVQAEDSFDQLLEIILDLGRKPFARFVYGERMLGDEEITHEEIEMVVERIGDFDADNRAGLERTLHRISGIRNRKGAIVGLTCRVGRAVYGTIDIIQDLVESDKSVLILGKPGIGKTTMLREAARILAEKKRVVIVDTSNEIGGDGDVPHPAVGKARRMQVARPNLQHEVMIEAVENHNPEVIVIDEIGRELEALAARTIAERGVQLIGTAHGRTMENLLINPTLSDLLGGIESVTLSDEEARRRGTQKTVLERRSPPTFDVLIEILDRDAVSIHADVSQSVDAHVRGYPIAPEFRQRNKNGEIHIEKSESQQASQSSMPVNAGFRRMTSTTPRTHINEVPTETYVRDFQSINSPLKKIKIYPFGVARNRLSQAAKRLNVPVELMRTLDDAEALITLRTYYRNRQSAILEAEERGIPIYILRSNTVYQMEQAFVELFSLKPRINPDTENEMEEITTQTEAAIQSVLNGKKYIDLSPADSRIRKWQHNMAKQANLISQSYGKEPNRHVRYFRD
ncbi:MAG: AAA family ATPase [Anaerolineaceae bacterium]|nr:AAA family ATPase [Anaerolineaceae bacterium]